MFAVNLLTRTLLTFTNYPCKNQPRWRVRGDSLSNTALCVVFGLRAQFNEVGLDEACKRFHFSLQFLQVLLVLHKLALDHYKNTNTTQVIHVINLKSDRMTSRCKQTHLLAFHVDGSSLDRGRVRARGRCLREAWVSPFHCISRRGARECCNTHSPTYPLSTTRQRIC